MDLEFLVRCMEAIGREHQITKSFLQQALLDIERNRVPTTIKLPWFDQAAQALAPCGHNIPLLARSSVSRHSKIQPPLPGRLPLKNPIGNAFGRHTHDCCLPAPWNFASSCSPSAAPVAAAGGDTSGNKRRRMQSPEAPGPSFSSSSAAAAAAAHDPDRPGGSGFGFSGASPHRRERPVSASPTPVSDYLRVTLAHRTMGSSASSPSGTRDTPSTRAGSSGAGAEAAEADPGDDDRLAAQQQAAQHSLAGLENMFADIENWDMTDGSVYTEFIEAARVAGGFVAALHEGDPWNLGDAGWDPGAGGGPSG